LGGILAFFATYEAFPSLEDLLSLGLALLGNVACLPTVMALSSSSSSSTLLGVVFAGGRTPSGEVIRIHGFREGGVEHK